MESEPYRLAGGYGSGREKRNQNRTVSEYKYECPLYIEKFGVVHPDFTFLSPKIKQEIYWEHDGRMDDPVYAQNAIKKIQAYEANGIYPGERLILTFETQQIPLDTRMIERLVNRYLVF